MLGLVLLLWLMFTFIICVLFFWVYTGLVVFALVMLGLYGFNSSLHSLLFWFVLLGFAWYCLNCCGDVSCLLYVVCFGLVWLLICMVILFWVDLFDCLFWCVFIWWLLACFNCGLGQFLFCLDCCWICCWLFCLFFVCVDLDCLCVDCGYWNCLLTGFVFYLLLLLTVVFVVFDYLFVWFWFWCVLSCVVGLIVFV